MKISDFHKNENKVILPVHISNYRFSINFFDFIIFPWSKNIDVYTTSNMLKVTIIIELKISLLNSVNYFLNGCLSSGYIL